MADALIDQYTKEELEQITSQCFSWSELILKLGYATRSGSNQKTVKNRIEKYGISTEHFSFTKGIERCPENVFIENSTASQATLRRWYLKEECSPYVCSICGQEPYWQGKEMTLILDHVNGHNKDDRLENLRWVCPNCNSQLDTTNGKNKPKKVKHYYCPKCGKEMLKNSKQCAECQRKEQTIPLDQMPVTREELKDMIRTLPFTVIGSKFGKTDNSIRKWCVKFDLPRTKKEINSYSDEEWESI